jgi:heat shock protein HspQ
MPPCARSVCGKRGAEPGAYPAPGAQGQARQWLNSTLRCGKECRKVEIMREAKTAKFRIGQVVRHRLFPFRGVIFDVDPEFANTDEWYEAIPAEVRPRKDQPFYHLLAENEETEYVAYVSEQNLLDDSSGEPVRHPQLGEFFEMTLDGGYAPKRRIRH